MKEYTIVEATGVATAAEDTPTGFQSFLNPAMDILAGSPTKGASYDLVRRGAMTLIGATVLVTSVATRSRIVGAINGGQAVPQPFLKYLF